MKLMYILEQTPSLMKQLILSCPQDFQKQLISNCPQAINFELSQGKCEIVHRISNDENSHPTVQNANKSRHQK